MDKKMDSYYIIRVLIILTGVFLFPFQTEALTLKLADFDSGRINKVGGEMDTWSRDSSDKTQNCSATFDTNVKRGRKGASLRLEYDVSSPYPAYNGFRTNLQGQDLSDYRAIVFWLKGEPKAGYTKRFKIELKNGKDEVGLYIVDGVADDWKQVIVPFEDFRGIEDFSNMNEFIIVFDDVLATSKEGTIYIDDISFITEVR